jgi:phosphoribosylglycinamide formyltransferase 2
VIYGGVEAEAIRFENVDEALRVPESKLRLFGKPVSYERRRMGVALATADNIETARKRAKDCAARVRPVK